VRLPELAAARRTHKEFAGEPLECETLLELLAVARFAPNHHLTQPWRFRVLGPHALERLKECAGPSEAVKLGRAPTLVLASVALSGELVQDEEDVCAGAAAIMLVLLEATERGLASYWRTPGILRTARGREAVGVDTGERVLGLLHFGAPTREPAARQRAAASEYVAFLE
jgi:nitroreductase